jgi:PII-like signaling protein
MNGSQLTLYARHARRSNGMTLVDWVLDEARQAGIDGATVFEGSEGIDHHGKYHAARFIELSDEPVAVTMAAEDARIDALIARLDEGGTPLFYMRVRVEYGKC